MNAALWVRGDYEHGLKMQAIQDKGSKRVMLQRSSSTTCQPLCEDHFTLEEERLQFIVQGLQLELSIRENGKRGL